LKQRLTYRSARDPVVHDELDPVLLDGPLADVRTVLEVVPAVATSIEETIADPAPQCLGKVLVLELEAQLTEVPHTDLSRNVLLPESK